MKIARVLSAEEAVFFHLRNTLDLFDGSYELTVIGPVTEEMGQRWPLIKWIKIDIGRKVSPWADLINFIKLILTLKSGHYDIVHSLGPKASLLSALAACIARVPTRLHTFTGQVWATKTGAFRWPLKQSDRLVCFLNTQCYTDSPSQTQFLISEGVCSSRKPLKVLAHGSLAGINFDVVNKINLQKFRDKFRQENSLLESDIVFIFLGRKTRDKGVFDILTALKKLENSKANFKFLFVGPDEDQFANALAMLPIPIQKIITNIGRVTNPLDYIFASDVLVLPSYREGFGTVVIEAAALGRPTIGTDIVGLKDAIIKNETGWLVPVADPEALKAAFVKVINNPTVIGRFGRNAEVRAVKKFSARLLYKTLVDEYIKLKG